MDTDGLMPFSRAIARSGKLPASSRIWIRVIDSIFYDHNRYTKAALGEYETILYDCSYVYVCICLCVCVCASERESESKRHCEREREREREGEMEQMPHSLVLALFISPTTAPHQLRCENAAMFLLVTWPRTPPNTSILQHSDVKSCSWPPLFGSALSGEGWRSWAKLLRATISVVVAVVVAACSIFNVMISLPFPKLTFYSRRLFARAVRFDTS